MPCCQGVGGIVKLKEAIDQARKTQGPKCRLGVLLRELPDIDAREFQDCLDADYAAERIARGMTELGHRLSGEAVRKHRAGACSCGAV